MVKNSKGITLVSLVITIILMLILIGLVLNVAINGGIFNQTTEAVKQTDMANIEEILQTEITALQMEKNEISDTDIEELVTGLNVLQPGFSIEKGDGTWILTGETKNGNVIRDIIIQKNGIGVKVANAAEESQPALPPPAGEPTSTQFDRTYGVIDIVWLDLSNKVITEPLQISATELGGLVPVKWTEMSGSYAEQTGIQNDPSSISDWYEYIAGTANSDNNNSRWANAKTTDENAYFVWIPRYAYKITYFNTQANANNYRANPASTTGIVGYSNIFGFVNESDQLLIESTPTNVTGIVRTAEYSDYIPHPAFEFDGAKKGIWVGKYESSGNATTVKIIPNTASLRGIKVSNIFTASQGVKATYSLSGDTHMMKNSEWGVVAYLTESKYGRNGTEIYINNNEDYITGISGGSTDASKSSDTTNVYNTPNGVKASTTGNIYGVYDMSGGSCEYVAGYIDNSNVKSGNHNTDLLDAVAINSKYADVYKATNDTAANNYGENKVFKGDAIFETSTSYSSSKGWHGDTVTFLSGSTAVFIRGRLLQ